MKKILGMGNALVDILASPPDDSLLHKYLLPKGSMQHIDYETSELILSDFEKLGCEYVAGGSAANTINGTVQLGMPSGFLGKVGKDKLAGFFKNNLIENGIDGILLQSNIGTGRAMTFISPDAERTFATYLGASIELSAEELKKKFFENYDYFHIEGYIVQNHNLLEQALKLAKGNEMLISLDLASYNVVEENREFLHYILKEYVNVVFANEEESKTFTGESPEESLLKLSELCNIAVVKIGKDGSLVKSKSETFHIPAKNANALDCTGAGDLYAAGFLYGLATNKPIDKCAEVGSVCASNVIEVIGTKIDDSRWKLIHNYLNL